MHTIETFQARDDKAAVRHLLAVARHTAERRVAERKEEEAAAVRQRLADAYARQQEVEWKARLLAVCVVSLFVALVAAAVR